MARLHCPYCAKPAKKTDGSVLYPHRPDLFQKTFYACMPCGAWVGCHPHSDTPLGRLANAALRQAKQAAHAAFDPLWREPAGTSRRNGHLHRSAAYAWLAERLGVPLADCHIGMFDEDMCARVVEVCRERSAS